MDRLGRHLPGGPARRCGSAHRYGRRRTI